MHHGDMTDCPQEGCPSRMKPRRPWVGTKDFTATRGWPLNIYWVLYNKWGTICLEMGLEAIPGYLSVYVWCSDAVAKSVERRFLVQKVGSLKLSRVKALACTLDGSCYLA